MADAAAPCAAAASGTGDDAPRHVGSERAQAGRAAAAAAPTILSRPLRLTVDTPALPSERMQCAKCCKRHLHYCPDCLLPAVGPALTLPRVRLPIKVHVLRGKEERASKSTSTHAAVLAPDDVTVYQLPDFPVYEHPERVLVLYPSPHSVPVASLDPSAFTHVIVLDTTWNKAGSVLTAREFMDKPFTFVHLSGGYHTLFWRHQPLGAACVSSLEALYFFLTEWHARAGAVAAAAAGAAAGAVGAPALEDDSASGARQAAAAAGVAASPHAAGARGPTAAAPLLGGSYDGRFDDLLLFFLYTYRRIQHEYTRGEKQGMAYHSKMRPGYIAGDSAASSAAVADGEPAAGEGDGDSGGEGDGHSRPTKRARVDSGPKGGVEETAGGGGGSSDAGAASAAAAPPRPKKGPGSRTAKGAWTVKTESMDAATVARLKDNLLRGGIDVASLAAPQTQVVPAAAAAGGAAAATDAAAAGGAAGATVATGRVAMFQRVVSHALHTYGGRLDDERRLGAAAAAAAAAAPSACGEGPGGAPEGAVGTGVDCGRAEHDAACNEEASAP